VVSGVDTTGPGTLTVGNSQNINTSNDLGGAVTSDANNTASIPILGQLNRDWIYRDQFDSIFKHQCRSKRNYG
jgi:hypothetical protein